MIIDAHTCVSPGPKGCSEGCDCSVEFLVESLAGSEVDKAVLMPAACDLPYDAPYIAPTANAFVAECCASYPDLFIGFASAHPVDGPDAPRRLEEDVRRFNLKGLKLESQLARTSPDDERIVPLVEKAAELDLPVAIDNPLPFTIDVLCKRVPEARIILCHAGGLRFLDALAVVIANDNAYLDISVSLAYFHDTPFEDQFLFVLKQAGARRVIYGSDHPQSPLSPCYAQAKAILESHGFAEDEQADIFGGTLLSILPGNG